MSAPGLLAAFALAACTTTSPSTPSSAGDDAPLAVRSWLEGSPKGGVGTLVVQLDVQDGVEHPDVGLPEVYGLTFRAEPARTERIGDHTVTTVPWTFHGKDGRYVIPALHAVGEGPSGQVTADAPALYVVIGEAKDSKIVDIVEPPRVRVIPAWAYALTAGAFALLGGLLWIALFGFGRRAPPPVVQEPPDVLALRAWEAVRRDTSLDDHQRALALSRIFREYAEAVLHFPAVKWSTSEIVAHLEALPHLEAGNVPRARQLLRATDRVKYAGEHAKTELFESLDADLRAFVASTKPYTWAAR